MLTLKYADHILFALSDATYDNYDIDIDMSLITIIKDGIEIIKPVMSNNVLTGTFDIVKVNDGIFKNHNEYFISLLDTSFASPQIITEKMCQAYDDRRIFREKFSYFFPPFAIMVANEGIEGIVVNELDYGSKRYIIVQVKEQKLVVLDCYAKVGDKVLLSFNFDEMSVTEIGRDIKII